MRESGSRYQRPGEGLLCACVSLLLGSAGHVAAGGRLPDAGALAAALAVLTIPGVMLAGWARRRFEAAVLCFGAQQVLVHLSLHTLAGHLSAQEPANSERAAAPDIGVGPSPNDLMDAAEPHASHAAHAVSPVATLVMGAWHLLAAFGTLVLLLHGGRMLRRLAGLVGRGFRLPARPGSPGLFAVPTLAPTVLSHVRFGVLQARSSYRRGPPTLVPARACS
ncbi:hypothetical protein AB0K87_05125 [Streptomyces sp. NPDC053705]|uniref:hypothetical protein n=1 Tax=Streptomyces TaxID=1883 RepID=UPI00342A404D